MFVNKCPSRDILDPGLKCAETNFGPGTKISGHFGPTFLGWKCPVSEPILVRQNWPGIKQQRKYTARQLVIFGKLNSRVIIKSNSVKTLYRVFI